MRLTISLSAAVLGLAALVQASNVIDLDPSNFDQYVGGKRGALVEFFAPWCGHCKNLAPVWEQLADAFPSDKVVIAKTDADGVGRELGSRFAVQGFPTLKWFPAGSDTPVDYEGGRDLDALASFVTDKSGVRSKIKPPAPPAAVQLTASNFDDIVLDQNKNVLVAFTAPWCGHCKNMKPAYENVARAFASESDCVVAQMDADAADNKPVAAKYDIRSFPTIKFWPKGSSEPVRYESGRSEEQFVEFLNKMCGTHRTASGLLSEHAGRVLPLDKLAYSFFTSAIPERPAFIKQAQEYLSELAASGNNKTTTAAEYYIKAMHRVADKGESWLTKEQARIAGLLASPSLAPTKLDELRIKANILSSFVTAKAEEAYDTTAEAFFDAAGKVAEGAEAVKDKVEEKARQIKAEL